MVANGSVEYDHGNDGTINSIGACLGSFRNKDYDTAIAVRYSKQVLTVSKAMAWCSILVISFDCFT